MNFTTSQHGSVTVLVLEGSLMGGPDATALNNTLHELVDTGNTKVVLDLHGVQFMNSSGLGLLIGGASALKNAGGALRLAAASAKILSLINITKLSNVLETYPTVDAAVARFTQ